MACVLLDLRAIELSADSESWWVFSRIKYSAVSNNLTLSPVVSKIEPKRNWL